MDHERWLKIEELMQEALDLESGERPAFLDRACGGDRELRSEVERILALDNEEFSFIERPAVEVAAMLADPEPEQRSGQHFGRYEIRELLGAGGMGEVYLALDTQLERKVALKLLPADYTADPERVRRFQQEARAASALNHPNIITIYEVGEHDGHLFIATEYIEGETLRRRMARGRLGAGEALEIAVQAAGALAAAHRAGIIHRDVKPENIMLRPDGYVKVLDFGLAKLTEQAAPAGDAADTTPGLILGTVRYMSPEQARAKGLDARTDVFSLGVVLYEMIAGSRPFEGDTTSDVIAEILRVEPPPVSHQAPGAPEALDYVLGRALAKKRDERYGSAGELLADLKSLARALDLGTEWTHMLTDSGGERALATSGARADAPTVEQSSSTWRRVREATSSGLHTAFGTTKRGVAVRVLLLGALLAPTPFVYRRARVTVPFEKVTITPIVVGKAIGYAAISPDGRYLVEGGESKSGGCCGIWLRHRATDSVTHLVDTKWFLFQPVFSFDSNYVYYNDAEFEGPNSEEPTAIVVFRIAVPGGQTQEIMRNPWSAVGVSPDGTRIAYTRKSPDESTTLCVANADGSDERVIASRALPEWFTRGGPAWSPDGANIVCGSTSGIVVVPAEGGDERPFRTEAFDEVGRIVWPVDGGGMLVIAGKRQERKQIWHLTYPGLEPRQITNDFENYTSLSVTSDAKTIVSTQDGTMSSLWVAPNGEASRARQIMSGRFYQFRGMTWTPDGRILLDANTTGTRQLWIMNADGSGRQQLTTGMNVTSPAASPDGRYLLFTSSDAENQMWVWRIDPDGGNPTRLAKGFGAQCSPDGWVFFVNERTLWKMRIEGGEPVRATELQAGATHISKDGTRLLSYFQPQDGGPMKLGIFSATTGKLVRTLDIPQSFARWSPDESGVIVPGPKGAAGRWVQPLDGGPPYQIAEMPPADAIGRAWSADGTLAYSLGQYYSDDVIISDSE